MVHCGYEPSAVTDMVANPLKALRVAIMGINTKKPFVPEISIDSARPSENVFSLHVDNFLAGITEPKVRESERCDSF